MMRPIMPLIFVVLGACTVLDTSQIRDTARFPEFPARLFSALQATCTEPAQQFRRISREIAECREFLEPEATAAIILSYDGTTTDLPQLVVRLSARAEGQDYLVTTATYLNVPQKDNGVRRVGFASPHFNRDLQALYRLTGGTPL